MSGLGLTACSGTTSHTGTAPRSWMTTLCQSLAQYQTSLATGTRNFEAAAPTYASLAAAKAGLVSYVQGAVGATDSVLSHVKAAGKPAVKDGSQIAQAIQTGLAQVKAAFAQAESQAAAIPTSDAASFERTAQSVNTELTNASNQAGQTFSHLDKKYPSPQLNQAAHSIGACALLFPKS
ncbi:MAG: hypothetical protein ACYCZM_00445 [Acidimicrobiales bacterium]